MKLDEAKKSYRESVLVSVDVIPNTAQKRSYILLMHNDDGESYFLVSNTDEILSFKSVDEAIKTLKSIGFRRAKLFI